MKRHLALPALLWALPAAAATPDIQQHVCPNGLTVVVVEDHAVPLVTVEIAAKNGSMTEPPELNGLSHLYEHMFFKANARYPDQESYLARIRELGIQFNGTTSTERVNYFFTTTSDHLDDAMQFMHDAIVTPRFDPKELERERVVVTGEMDRAQANPSYDLHKASSEALWWRFPSRKDPLGNRQTVLATTVEQMKLIQGRYYVPNNAALFVSGDVSAAKIFAAADALYVDWARGEDPFVKFPLVAHPPLKHSRSLFVEKDVKTFSGSLQWHGPSTVPEEFADTYAADVLGTLVGQPASRFHKAIVDSGACLDAGLGWFTQRNVGPISVGFQAEPEKGSACIAAIWAELPKLAEPGYFSKAEFDNAAFTLEVSKLSEREKPSEYSHVLSFWWSSASLDYERTYLEEVRKVGEADLARFMNRWVLGKPVVLGAMGSPEMTKAGTSAESLGELIGLRPSPFGALESMPPQSCAIGPRDLGLPPVAPQPAPKSGPAAAENKKPSKKKEVKP